MFRDIQERHEKHNGGVMAEINITPFTDVVLVLLIIFMIATPIIVGSGIKVQLPQAETGKTEQEGFITVSIDALDNVYLDNKKVPVEDLSSLVNEVIRRRPGLMVKVNGDRSVKYGTIVKVLDAARTAGAIRYMLVSERLNKGS
ncbi:MAG: ExbD/TolR family protein [Syntrophobacteraceae bacterium]